MKFTARARPTMDGWKLEGEIEDDDLTTPPLTALANWLRALDPEEVERVALERCGGLGGEPFSKAMLELLAEWAEGAP